MIDPPTTDEPTDAVTNAPAEHAMTKKSPKKAATKAPRELPKNGFEEGNMRRRLLVRRGICNAPGSEQELNN